jgi:hypothetical protein
VTNLIVVGVIDQAMFTVDQDPVETSWVDDAFSKRGRGVSVYHELFLSQTSER